MERGPSRKVTVFTNNFDNLIRKSINLIYGQRTFINVY